jgi:hypothetical protein
MSDMMVSFAGMARLRAEVLAWNKVRYQQLQVRSNRVNRQQPSPIPAGNMAASYPSAPRGGRRSVLLSVLG